MKGFTKSRCLVLPDNYPSKFLAWLRRSGYQHIQIWTKRVGSLTLMWFEIIHDGKDVGMDLIWTTDLHFINIYIQYNFVYLLLSGTDIMLTLLYNGIHFTPILSFYNIKPHIETNKNRQHMHTLKILVSLFKKVVVACCIDLRSPRLVHRCQKYSCGV